MAKQTLPPYILRVLTSEYLIEGTVPGDTSLYFPENPETLVTPLHLHSVNVQLTRSTNHATYSYQNYFLKQSSAMAYIPEVDFTQLPQYKVWKVSTNLVNGVFYVGPYCMTGRMMSLRPDLISGEMPAFDVQFKSQFSGTQWAEINAPFALVNGAALHGWGTA